MSAVADILAELSSRGVTVRVDGETLRLKPGDALDDGLVGRVKAAKGAILEELARRSAEAVAPPPMPKGVRLVAWQPKCAPVAIDVCSVVVDVPKFIEAELRSLDSRLNNPWAIKGGFSIWQILDRLHQAGVTVELDLKGGTKCQSTE